MNKNITELHNDIIMAIYSAEVAAKTSAGEHHNVVLKSDGTVYDGFGVVWDKENDTELFVAYRDPRGIEENDRGIDKDYAKLFAVHSEVYGPGIILSDGQHEYDIVHYINKEKNIDRIECEIA